jgi:hypothetical protein
MAAPAAEAAAAAAKTDLVIRRLEAGDYDKGVRVYVRVHVYDL